MNQHKTEAQILDTLALLGGQLSKPEDLTFEGTRFVIPASMDLRQARVFLKDYAEAQEMSITFERTFPFRPFDGARAAANVFRNTFGAVMQVSTLFNGATMVTVQTSRTTTEQVPWGQMVIPALESCIITFAAHNDKDGRGDLFHMSVYGPKRCEAHAEGLFKLVAAELESNSIYRSQAIDGSMAFLDLDGIDPDKVTYSADVMQALDANLWSVIRHADAQRTHGLPIKRSILLEGPYGTGKTMAAYLTAKIATGNGFSFHYCRPDDDLAAVLATAALYGPSVVFFEDVDRLADPRGMSTDGVSVLLDAFDGIGNKGAEVIMVMTTNHVDRIHRGMLRPGRLDHVCHIGPLDAAGIQTLITNVIAPDLLGLIDWSVVCDAMSGYLPSFVREAAEHSVRYAIARGNGKPGWIETEDLIAAADGLRFQHDLMLTANEHDPQTDSLTEAFGSVVVNAVSGMVADLALRVDLTGGNLAEAIENRGDQLRGEVDEAMADNLNSTTVNLDNDSGYLSR